MHVSTGTNDNVVVLSVVGRLDFATSSMFQEQLETVIRDAGPIVNALVIDCAELAYVSSAGLRAFLVGARSAKRRNMSFCVCGMVSLVRKIFSVSGFDRMIDVFADREAALQEYRVA